MSRNSKIFIVVLILIVIFIFRYEIYYLYLGFITPKSINPKNEEKLKELHPILRYKVSKIIKAAENKGCEVILNSGYRPPEYQNYLYQTNQTPTEVSKHSYRAAIDMNICGLMKADSSKAWKEWGDLAKSLGLRWGGDFQSYHDPVHFELTTTIDELKEAKKTLIGDYVKIWN